MSARNLGLTPMMMTTTTGTMGTGRALPAAACERDA